MRPRRPPSLVTVLLGALLAAACEGRNTGDFVTPAVVLVSIDGFRWDLRDYGDTPILDSLFAVGTSAAYMIPAFPTATFTTHYTMATGLRAERHGIIWNTMFDPTRNAWFRRTDRATVEDPQWWGGEPIWVTAERQGVTAATFFWPGTEAPIRNRRATYWRQFDASIPPDDRVDQVLAWLALPPREQPQLITLYFDNIDRTVHDHALDARETRLAIEATDRALGRLTDGLATMGLREQVNLVIVSDHGIAERSPRRAIRMDELIDIESVSVITWSPVWMGGSLNGDHEALYRSLVDAHPHLTVYRRADLPDRFHLKGSDRVPPIVAIADAGWSIGTTERFARNPGGLAGHTHGYDNRERDMAAIFVASGPAFNERTVVAPFESVHIYALICAVLGITPADHDGSLEAVRGVLRR